MGAHVSPVGFVDDLGGALGVGPGPAAFAGACLAAGGGSGCGPEVLWSPVGGTGRGPETGGLAVRAGGFTAGAPAETGRAGVASAAGIGWGPEFVPDGSGDGGLAAAGTATGFAAGIGTVGAAGAGGVAHRGGVAIACNSGRLGVRGRAGWAAGFTAPGGRGLAATALGGATSLGLAAGTGRAGAAGGGFAAETGTAGGAALTGAGGWAEAAG
jgi:hypothetical protein